MVLTAAVGGLVPGMAAGTIVVLRDHLNMMGASPLRGWRYPDGTPAFVDARAMYDAEAARDMALEAAQELGIRAAVGVYAAMSGPAYETPARSTMLPDARRHRRRHVGGARGAPGPRARDARARTV